MVCSRVPLSETVLGADKKLFVGGVNLPSYGRFWVATQVWRGKGDQALGYPGYRWGEFRSVPRASLPASCLSIPRCTPESETFRSTGDVLAETRVVTEAYEWAKRSEHGHGVARWLVGSTDQSAPRLVPPVSPDRRCVPATWTPGIGSVRLS